VHPQLQPGRYYLGATTLRGRFSGEQMIAVADIADRFGSGEVRCTNRQNIIVLGVPDAQVEEADASLADIGLPTRASTYRRGVISCTGMEFCKLAIVETKQRAAELIDHLERRVGDIPGSLRINLNGCPNACAQYQIADIGLQGGIARLPEGGRVQGFILHIGGRLGADAGFGRRVSSKALPAEDAKYAVERLVRAYTAERPAAPERTPALDLDVVLGVEIALVALLESGMQFDLVDHWRLAGLGDDALEMVLVKVGHPDRSDPALLLQLHQGLPCLDIQSPAGYRPVNEEEVELVAHPRQRADRGAGREEAADGAPVVVDPGPVGAFAPR